MFSLQRHLRANNDRMGDILELTNVRDVVELIPQFGKQIDRTWNCNTSLELARNFYLNNFADKDTFHAILSYQ